MTNTDKNDFNATIGNTVLSAVHLAPYLPYELRFSDGTILHSIDIDNELMLLDTKTSGISNHRIEWGCILPILRPMTDLTKKIKINNVEIIVKENLSKNLQMMIDVFDIPSIEDIKVYDYNKLLELHFDVFGLIEKGLAVDINTLSVE